MQFTVRTALLSDLSQLTALKPTEALHLDRIVLGCLDPNGFRYLVLEASGSIVGFVCLLLRFSHGWPTPGDALLPFPRIIDLYVDPVRRSAGLGGLFLAKVEKIAAASGAHALHLSVDPIHNGRAQKFYRRRGYREINEVVPTTWHFQDSAGNIHSGHATLQEMAILLPKPEAAVSR